jgi:hypothetical protein
MLGRKGRTETVDIKREISTWCRKGRKGKKGEGKERGEIWEEAVSTYSAFTRYLLSSHQMHTHRDSAETPHMAGR